MLLFQKTDGPVECSSTGRVKRKGRQDISYKLFFSENIDEEELQDYFSRRNNRFELSLKFIPPQSNVPCLNILLVWKALVLCVDFYLTTTVLGCDIV